MCVAGVVFWLEFHHWILTRNLLVNYTFLYLINARKIERIKIFQSKSTVTKVEYIAPVDEYTTTLSGIIKCTKKLPQKFK